MKLHEIHLNKRGGIAYPTDSEDERAHMQKMIRPNLWNIDGAQPPPLDSEDEKDQMVRKMAQADSAMWNRDGTRVQPDSDDERVKEACRQLATRYDGSSDTWTSESERGLYSEADFTSESEQGSQASYSETELQSSDNSDAHSFKHGGSCHGAKTKTLWLRRGRVRSKRRGPPISNRNPCRFPLYDDCEVKRIVPPREALFTIMSQDEIPPMPVMESDSEGAVPEELSDVSEVDNVADDEHEAGSFGQQRDKQYPRALVFASENSHGQTNQNSAAIPSGLAGKAGFEKVSMSKESLKEWEENRKALRAARRAGRMTYGEYLKGQSDSQPLPKPLGVR
jgi:hypothetical protein